MLKKTTKESYQTKALSLLQRGAEHKRLGVPGEDKLNLDVAVSYCAVCDYAFL